MVARAAAPAAADDDPAQGQPAAEPAAEQAADDDYDDRERDDDDDDEYNDEYGGSQAAGDAQAADDDANREQDDGGHVPPVVAHGDDAGRAVEPDAEHIIEDDVRAGDDHEAERQADDDDTPAEPAQEVARAVENAKVAAGQVKASEQVKAAEQVKAVGNAQPEGNQRDDYMQDSKPVASVNRHAATVLRIPKLPQVVAPSRPRLGKDEDDYYNTAPDAAAPNASKAASRKPEPPRALGGIPRVLHYTARTPWLDADWKSRNPQWRVEYYNDDRMAALVRQHRPSLYALFPGLHIVEKADIFRYVALWGLGGVYTDTDVHPVANIDKWPSEFGYTQAIKKKNNNKDGRGKGKE